jgi:predicted TIM-barrel fold metal-dependent hydrolase
MEILHSLFDYAMKNNLPILIHTGHSGVDCANRFEHFMDEYSGTKCILAHCRPLDVTIEMLQKYDNVYCDTAFAPRMDVRKIVSCGFKDKIIFGSDFPITHFFKTKYPDPGDNSSISLKEQYTEDIADWEFLETEFTRYI